MLAVLSRLNNKWHVNFICAETERLKNRIDRLNNKKRLEPARRFTLKGRGRSFKPIYLVMTLSISKHVPRKWNESQGEASMKKNCSKHFLVLAHKTQKAEMNLLNSAYLS